MASNPDEWPEIIAPGAFDRCLPAEVPLTDKPGGEQIGTATVSADAQGLPVTMTYGDDGAKAAGRVPPGH